MADVVFNLDAENSKALLALGRVTKSLQNLEKAHAKSAGAARMQDRATDGAAQTLGKLGRAMAGLAGVAGVGSVLRSFTADLEMSARASAGLEKTLRPLLSLGDNARDIGKIRGDVLTTSTGLGRSTQETADAFFALQSGASNLSDTLQRDLFKSASDLAFLQNGDLSGSVNLLVKFYQNYGKEVGSVTELSDKLFAAADKGALTLDELASLGPDVAAAARVANVSMEELLATLIVTTQQLGKNEKTFTAVRNIILRMSNAQKEGINLTGSFTDQLKQLSSVDPDVLKKIFGDETIGAISVAAQNAEQIAAAVQSLDASAGSVQEKMRAIVSDARQLAAINLASADQASVNNLAGGDDPGARTFALRRADIKTGLNENTAGQALRALGLGDFTATLGAGALGLNDFLGSNVTDIAGQRGILDTFEGFSDIGRGRRLDAQQRSNPEAFRANLQAEGGVNLVASEAAPFINGSNTDPEDLKKLSQAARDLVEAARLQVSAARAQERAANRRNVNAQRE